MRNSRRWGARGCCFDTEDGRGHLYLLRRVQGVNEEREVVVVVVVIVVVVVVVVIVAVD